MSEAEPIPEIETLPDVDYSDLPQDIESVVGETQYMIEKDAELTWDQNQWLVRIPKEIGEELDLSEDSRVTFTFEKPLPDSDKEPTVKIEMHPE